MIKYLQEIWHDLTYREPTPQQIRNQQKLRRWWRSFKKEGELMFPFILGIIVLGFVGYIATTL